jgi:hypothetical protein
VAMVFGALALILAAGMFWILGRAAGLRVPYVPARNCARASFVMVLGTIVACLVTFCFFIGLIGAAAQAGPNGGPPPPDVVLMTLVFMGSLALTAGLAGGAEITGLVGLGRIGDALHDRAAAGWARRSIVVMVLAGGLMVFGFCGVLVYASAKEQQRQQQAQAGANPGPAAPDKGPAKGKGKAADQDKAGNAKDAAPAPPAAANGAGQNPPPEPIDGPLAIILDLVFFIPLLVFLIHYSVALQAGRRAIRHEIDVLLGRDHEGHDRPY